MAMTKIEHIPANQIVFIPAVVAYLIKDDNVLLGLRKKVSLGMGKNLIAGIGGKIGDKPEFKGESHVDTLRRELLEEIKVTPISYDYRGQVSFMYPHKPEWNMRTDIFLVRKWSGEPQETDSIKPMWFPKNNVPYPRMWPDNVFWVPKILKGERVRTSFVYDEDGRVKEIPYI